MRRLVVVPIIILLFFSTLSAQESSIFYLEQSTEDTEILYIHKETFQVSDVTFSIEIIELNASQIELCFSHKTLIGEYTKCFTHTETGLFDYTEKLEELKESDQIDSFNQIYVTMNGEKGNFARGSYRLTVFNGSFALGTQKLPSLLFTTLIGLAISKRHLCSQYFKI